MLTNILENLEAISYLLTLQNLPLDVRFFSTDSAMGFRLTVPLSPGFLSGQH